VKALTVTAVREDRGRFAALRDRRVLIYWPHGLGDWVHLSAILPLLEPSNAYAIARFGDDYVSVMEGNAYVEPLASGVDTPDDGSSRGTLHLGLRLRECNGRKRRIAVPSPLSEAVARFAPDTLLWTDYPETEGRTPYPFHTKARNLARLLVRPERLAGIDLSPPLPSTLDFSVPVATQRLVDDRLLQFAPAGARIGVISRSGVTASRKAWGDASEARAFVAAMQGDGPWRFISMDDETLGEGVGGFRALFGDIGEPFARLYKALAARIDLFVGIPAGPLHLTLARGGVPVVGLWMAHHPDWYDEPNSAAIHVVGRYVRDRRFDRRAASTSKPPSLAHRIIYLDTLEIPADAVVDVARALT
jgi:hypothetical protein